MLKLFGGGADHPLRNPKEARRILEALPAEDLKALEELAHWLESGGVAEGFKAAERAAPGGTVDGTARPSRYQENRMWTQLHEYWKQAGLAFGRTLDGAAQAPKALEPKSLALAATRALRAAAQQIKWQHMRYGPVDPAAWGILNKVYAYCEARGLAEGKLALYGTSGATGAADTSPKQEFVRALMFSASSPDSLLAAEVELVE